MPAVDVFIYRRNENPAESRRVLNINRSGNRGTETETYVESVRECNRTLKFSIAASFIRRAIVRTDWQGKANFRPRTTVPRGFFAGEFSRTFRSFPRARLAEETRGGRDKRNGGNFVGMGTGSVQVAINGRELPTSSCWKVAATGIRGGKRCYLKRRF